jgi:2-polyprenyl-3-methyl-5-hydroxy-6-metoxy-1,4-benzoquinol methylase
MQGLAQFRERDRCITCEGDRLTDVATGSYDDDPLHGHLARDPWGESPLPALKGAQWRLVECADCSTRFHGRILTPEWRTHCLSVWMSGEALAAFSAAEGQNNFAVGYAHATNWIGHALSIEAMTRDRGARPPRILDFGCGSGAFLAQAALFGAEAYGVDAAPARRELAAHAAVTIVSNLSELPGELRGQFDSVSMFEVLEHLDDPRELLAALGEWVRPGGVLVLETPNAGHIADMVSVDNYRAIHPLDHVNAFSPATLADIAARCGFRPVLRQFAFTSDSVAQSARREARRILSHVRPASTQQYFRKV